MEPAVLPSTVIVDPLPSPVLLGRGDGRSTPLVRACAQGEVTEVIRLIRNGVSLNDPDGHLWTPLHHAVHSPVRAGDVAEIVRLLRQAGARDDRASRDGETPLDLAQRMGVSAVVLDALTVRVDADAMLWTLIGQWKSPARGYDQRCRQALALEANPWTRNPELQAHAVSWAVQHDCGGAIARFRQAGTDLNGTVDSDGMTLLMEAALHGRLIATYALLRAGVDVNCRNLRGNTALHLAMLDESIPAALLAAGADPDIPDSDHRNLWQRIAHYATTSLSSSERKALDRTHQVLVEHTVKREVGALHQVLQDVLDEPGHAPPLPARSSRRL